MPTSPFFYLLLTFLSLPHLTRHAAVLCLLQTVAGLLHTSTSHQTPYMPTTSFFFLLPAFLTCWYDLEDARLFLDAHTVVGPAVQHSIVLVGGTLEGVMGCHVAPWQWLTSRCVRALRAIQPPVECGSGGVR